MDSIDQLIAEVIGCRQCPRLVAWREEVAATKRAMFRDEPYWGRAVPPFGDPHARLVVLGLAPAAHGANRTGRLFTGDRSGDWLFRALHRAGLANKDRSEHLGDGLELRGAWMTATVRCAPPGNAPSVDEQAACRPYLQRELALFPQLRVVLCLGGLAFAAACRELGVRPRPRFGHGVEVTAPCGVMLLGSYHPSQQNTFTGRLTEEMLDAVARRAADLAATPR
jgi:uracil-DNA glycosylase